MFVNILSFKLNRKKGISSNELSMIEDDMSSKPKGLDRLHIFKDKKKDNKFYLIEYWNTIDSKNEMEESDQFPLLNRIHHISDRKRSKRIECDVVI